MVTSRTVKYFLLFVQAVRETALSRAALYGTTAAVPNLLVLLLQRSVTFKRLSVCVDQNPTCQTLPHGCSFPGGDFSRGALC